MISVYPSLKGDLFSFLQTTPYSYIPDLTK